VKSVLETARVNSLACDGLGNNSIACLSTSPFSIALILLSESNILALPHPKKSAISSPDASINLVY